MAAGLECGRGGKRQLCNWIRLWQAGSRRIDSTRVETQKIKVEFKVRVIWWSGPRWEMSGCNVCGWMRSFVLCMRVCSKQPYPPLITALIPLMWLPLHACIPQVSAPIHWCQPSPRCASAAPKASTQPRLHYVQLPTQGGLHMRHLQQNSPLGRWMKHASQWCYIAARGDQI